MRRPVGGQSLHHRVAAGQRGRRAERGQPRSQMPDPIRLGCQQPGDVAAGGAAGAVDLLAAGVDRLEWTGQHGSAAQLRHGVLFPVDPVAQRPCAT